MWIRKSRLLASLALVAGAILVAGCGGGDEEDFNQTDATFAAQMLPHHEHALEMAELATMKSSDPGVTDLAARIIDTQEQEIAELEGFLDVFETEAAEPAAAVMSLNEGIISELEAASEASFDELFLKEMSAHHSSAVDMAGIEIAGGEHEDTVALAEAIEATQLEEIGEMQELRGVVPAEGGGTEH